MAHADRPTPPIAARPHTPRDARALVGLVARVTYPYLLGGVLAYLTLTVVSHDIGLMCAGAVLVLYGAALTKAVQGHVETRGADGAQ